MQRWVGIVQGRDTKTIIDIKEVLWQADLDVPSSEVQIRAVVRVLIDSLRSNVANVIYVDIIVSFQVISEGREKKNGVLLVNVFRDIRSRTAARRIGSFTWNGIAKAENVLGKIIKDRDILRKI